MKLYPKKVQAGKVYYECTLSMLVDAENEEEAMQNFANILREAGSNMESLLESGRDKSLLMSNISFTVKAK